MAKNIGELGAKIWKSVFLKDHVFKAEKDQGLVLKIIRWFIQTV